MAYPGLGFDPTPGEAAAVDGALTQIGRGRRQVEGCVGDLRAALRVGGWTGPAAAAYRSSVADLPRALEQADRSLERAGRALETWLHRLLDNQREASRLDARARALRGSPDLEGELRRTLDAARRLHDRHLRQATAAAAALRAGVWVWESAADGVAVAAGQVSGWTGQVAWLGAPPGVGSVDALTGVPGAPADLASVAVAGVRPGADSGVRPDPLGLTDPAGARPTLLDDLTGARPPVAEAPGRTAPAGVRVDLSSGRVVDLPMTAPARARVPRTGDGPTVSRPSHSTGTARPGDGRAEPVDRGRASEGPRPPAARAVQHRAEPATSGSTPHRDRPAQPVGGVTSGVPRTSVGATPAYSPEPVDQHVQASAVTIEDVGRPTPAAPSAGTPGVANPPPAGPGSFSPAVPGPGTVAAPGVAPAAPGAGGLEPGRVTGAEPGHRPANPAAATSHPGTDTDDTETDLGDAALLIAAAGLPTQPPATPATSTRTPTPTTGLGVYLVCCGSAQMLVLAEERGDTVRRTMFLSAS